MSATDRTVQERDKARVLSGIDADLLKRTQVMQIGSLDLSLLPTETIARMCHLDIRTNHLGEAEVFVNESPDKFKIPLNVKTNEITLRQVNFVKITPKDKNKVTVIDQLLGASVRMPTRGGQSVKYPLAMDGSSVHMLTTEVQKALDNMNANGQSTPDRVQILDSTLAKQIAYAFIPQHTITFPKVFKERESVSFLGLPAGTKLFTANGGEFEVVCRQNVSLDAHNNATGHLALSAKNARAGDLVIKEGWGTVIINNIPCCLVSSNLMTSSTRTKFVMDKTVLPYVNPLSLGMFGYYYKTRVLRDSSTVVVHAPGTGMAFVVDTDSIGNDLDKFMFG